ncbi:MAG: hypothetical protein ACK47J_07005, partial [Pseudanabaena sp.]
MTKALSEIAQEKGIRYFLISFTDLFGVQRSKLVPTAAIDSMEANGAGFAGFATWLDMTPADPDLFAIPDRNSLFPLPWQPEIGWMPADLYMNGEPVKQAPRYVLKQALSQAEALGYRVKTGVECEYFLLSADGTDISDLSDRASKPCYDQQALMRRFDIIAEICDAMLAMGWGAYQNDHEDANGQFEMNWTYADALVTADRHSLFPLPWQPEIGWMPADLYMNGEPVKQAPRYVLKQALSQAEALGYRVKTGVECEYFLLSADGTDISDLSDRASKPCYDQQALMRRFDIIAEICDAMLAMGWGAYQNDHEDANGQFEMNWTYADALVTADRHAFFKYMVKAIAEKHGFRATFMPKPFPHLTGNGCHTHLSIWDLEGNTNL